MRSLMEAAQREEEEEEEEQIIEEQTMDKIDAELSEYRRKATEGGMGGGGSGGAAAAAAADDRGDGSGDVESPERMAARGGAGKERGRGSNDSEGSEGGGGRRVRFVPDKAKKGFGGFGPGKAGYGPISDVSVYTPEQEALARSNREALEDFGMPPPKASPPKMNTSSSGSPGKDGKVAGFGDDAEGRAVPGAAHARPATPKADMQHLAAIFPGDEEEEDDDDKGAGAGAAPNAGAVNSPAGPSSAHQGENHVSDTAAAGGSRAKVAEAHGEAVDPPKTPDTLYFDGELLPPSRNVSQTGAEGLRKGAAGKGLAEGVRKGLAEGMRRSRDGSGEGTSKNAGAGAGKSVVSETAGEKEEGEAGLSSEEKAVKRKNDEYRIRKEAAERRERMKKEEERREREREEELRYAEERKSKERELRNEQKRIRKEQEAKRRSEAAEAMARRPSNGQAVSPATRRPSHELHTSPGARDSRGDRAGAASASSMSGIAVHPADGGRSEQIQAMSPREARSREEGEAAEAGHVMASSLSLPSPRQGEDHGSGARAGVNDKERDQTLAKVEYLLAVNNVASPPRDGAARAIEGKGREAVDEATVAEWDRAERERVAKERERIMMLEVERLDALGEGAAKDSPAPGIAPHKDEYEKLVDRLDAEEKRRGDAEKKGEGGGAESSPGGGKSKRVRRCQGCGEEAGSEGFCKSCIEELLGGAVAADRARATSYKGVDARKGGKSKVGGAGSKEKQLEGQLKALQVRMIFLIDPWPL